MTKQSKEVIMNKIIRLAVLVSLILLSLVFYGAGSETGLVLFFAFGLLFEGAFWFGLLGAKKNNKPSIAKQSS